MSYLFYHTMQDNVGNLLFDVSGTMRLAGSATLATIYGDPGLGIILPNPMTNHPSYGSFKCYMSAGNYDFYMAKAGYSFETLTGIQADGTLAQQDATNVNVDNLTVDFAAQMNNLGVGTPADGAYSIKAAFASLFQATLGIGAPPDALYSLAVGFGALVHHDKATRHGMTIRPTDADTGVGAAINFNNLAGSSVGTVTTTATTTAYNTTSDVRLKHDVETLTGELEAVRALRPVRFLWNADNSPGVGFLAHEVAAHVQGVITGEADERNPDGTIKPQMIDYSKLVPFLVGAVQTLAARVAVLEDALGV